MRTFQISNPCPACDEPLEKLYLHCQGCGSQIRANPSDNEFALLNADDLHFLRIFVRFEGRIKDMEAPLGLSYPTIRTRIHQLNETLSKFQSQKIDHEKLETAEILQKIALKEITFDEAMNIIKKKEK